MNKTKQYIKHENGVTYFTKDFERIVFFVLTMAMLVWGVVEFIKNTIS